MHHRQTGQCSRPRRRAANMRPTPLATLPLLLAAATATGVHVQSSPGDIGLPDQGAEEGGPVRYDGHQVLRVFIANNSTVDILRSYDGKPGVDFWTEPSGLAPTVDVMVSPDVRRELTDQLTSSGATYTVNIHDVQEAITQQTPASPNTASQLNKSQRVSSTNRQGHRLTWTAYNRLDDYHQYLDYVALTYPDVCDTFSIGTSTEGRDLKGVKCGFGQREIWMDGGTHAREWISPAVVTYLIREFSEKSHSCRDILKDFTIFLLPVLNPDGYEYSHTENRMWRKTRSKNNDSSCIGVDPNRNFDIHWREVGASISPCSKNYAGPRPFSEPETTAVKEFLLSHASKLDMFMSFHSYAQVLFVPYAHTTERPDDFRELLQVARQGVKAIREAGGPQFQVGQVSRLLYPVAGSANDWAKAVAGIKYSYTFELRDDGKYGFLLPADQIEPSGQEMTAGVMAMLRAVAWPASVP